MYNIPVSCVKPTPATCLALFLAAMACAAPSAAFYPLTHVDIVSRAVSGICKKGLDKPLCAEFRENLPFLQFGARMEDSGYEGFTEVYNGELFYDEETPGTYGPCSSYLSGEKAQPYCNHFFFVENYQATGTKEGACGSGMTGATDPDCEGKAPFQWESSRQRAQRLWRERVLPYYFGGGSRARAYYWLGRTAHLLADAGVPGHVVPHGLDRKEFEHRAYEKAAVDSPYKEAGAAAAAPGDINGLFTRLALLAIATDGQVRKEAADALSRPGRGFLDEEFSDWAGSILSLHPAVKRELVLAGEISGRIKPAVVSSTEKLFEIFGARAGLVSAGIEPQPVRPAGASQVSMPDFDGRRPAP